MPELIMSRAYGDVQVAEPLAGGDVGIDMQESEAGFGFPVYHTLYIRAFDVINPITSLAFHLAPYSNPGTYGGDADEATDYANLLAQGDAGYGIEIDMKWNDSAFNPINVFTIATGFADQYTTRQVIDKDAMVSHDGLSELDASNPADGLLALPPNAIIGDAAHIRIRSLVPAAETQSGIKQFDLVFDFNFTT